MPVPRWTSPRRRTTNEDDDLFGSDDDPVDEPTADTLPIDDSDKAAVVVTSKRQVLPSSMGLSLLAPRACRDLEVTVRWGDYQPEYAKADGEPSSDDESFALDGPAQRCQAEETPQDRRLVASAARADGDALLSTAASTAPASRPSPTPTACGSSGSAAPPPRRPSTRRSFPTGLKRSTSTWSTTREPTAGAAKDRSTAFQAELTVTLRRRVRAPAEPERLEFDGRRRPRGRPSVRATSTSSPSATTSRRSPEVDDDEPCRTVRTAWVPKAQVERVEPAKLAGITLGMETLGRLSPRLKTPAPP